MAYERISPQEAATGVLGMVGHILGDHVVQDAPIGEGMALIAQTMLAAFRVSGATVAIEYDPADPDKAYMVTRQTMEAATARHLEVALATEKAVEAL